MEGFEVTFFTHEGQHHGNEAVYDWLMRVLSEQDIDGATLTMGDRSFGRSGHVHKEVIDMPDLPVIVTAAMNVPQADALFHALEVEQADVFFIKSKIEFGVLGAMHVAPTS